MRPSCRVPFRDLRVDDPSLRRRLLAAVERVLAGGRIILGPEVTEFEQRVAAFCGQRFAVGVGSGTDALYLALRSLGVGPGDEVVTTPLSWVATANAIRLCGARPRFADIGGDLNIDPGAIAREITPRTKVILPVHFTGRLCRMDEILAIAADRGIHVVEDAAQAFGAYDAAGRRAGAFGIVGCFSMNPMKVLSAFGEAGCVVTDDEELYEKLLSLRYAGTVNKENCREPALNGRLDTVQAAMLLVALEFLDRRIERLRQIANIYSAELHNVVGCPEDDEGHVYYTYTILAERRDELMRFLWSRGVETKIQHPILIPFQDAYKQMCSNAIIPRATDLVRKILSIPCHDKMSDDDVGYVVESIRTFYRS